jgi:hypothetical protein
MAESGPSDTQPTQSTQPAQTTPDFAHLALPPITPQQVVTVTDPILRQVCTDRLQDAIRCLQTVVNGLNERGVRINNPVGAYNVFCAVKTAWEMGVYSTAWDEWKLVWANDVPEPYRFGPGAPQEAQQEEIFPLVPEETEPTEVALEGPGEAVNMIDEAIRRLNLTDPQPARVVPRVGGMGAGFLPTQVVTKVRTKFRRLYFPGIPVSTAQQLMGNAETSLALTLAHTGTSPQMDPENVTIILKGRSAERGINVSEWLRWMIDGGDGTYGGDSWLRKYARTVLAPKAFRQLRASHIPTPFVAHYGVPTQAKAIAFDFSDSIPPNWLNRVEARTRATLRLCAVTRSPQQTRLSLNPVDFVPAESD